MRSIGTVAQAPVAGRLPVTLSATETALLGWLAGQYGAMLELLGRLVDTDLGSYDKDGVARAGAIIREHLEARGIPCEEILQSDGSVSIRATVRPREAAPTPRTSCCSGIGTPCSRAGPSRSGRFASRAIAPMAPACRT